LCQSALDKELDLLIRRAVLLFRESRVWANSSEFNPHGYSDLALLHLALAAFLAISLRSSGVVPSHLAFPPIFPPSLPKRANSSRTPLGTCDRFLALRMSSSLAVQEALMQAADNKRNRVLDMQDGV
jgi:hypothetical protein